MNKYMKPTFMLASLGVNALAAGGCSITEADRKYFDRILGAGWEETAFGSTEQECEDNSIDNYCKFTSGDSTSYNIKQVFIS